MTDEKTVIKQIRSVRDLEVYQLAFQSAMLIFNISKGFPQEASETQTWLEFAFECGYLPEITFNKLDKDYEHIFAMLISMERKADSFCRRLSLLSSK